MINFFTISVNIFNTTFIIVFYFRAYPGDEEILSSYKRIVTGIITHPITIGKVI